MSGGVFWDRGGQGGIGWGQPGHSLIDRVIWLILSGVRGWQGKQNKQSRGAKWSPVRTKDEREATGTVVGKGSNKAKVRIGEAAREWKMAGWWERGTHPYTGVLTTHHWMNRLPPTLTVANKGQRQRDGRRGRGGGGGECVFSPLL